MLELLLVMAILAVVVGGSLGLFAALDVGKRQAAGLVKNVLRSAQNSAIARQGSARVRIDTEAGTLQAESLRVVGTWHFEKKKLKGAFGLDGGANQCEFVPGFIGDGLSFGGRYGATAEIPVQRDPAFDFAQGFSVEFAVFKDGPRGGRLLRFGSACVVEIGAAGEVRGRVTPVIEKNGTLQPGGNVTVLTDAGMIPPQRWTRVRLSYDRNALSLAVDGVLVAATPETAPVWKLDGPLILSDSNRPFDGAIDGLVVSAVVADEIAELPETVRFSADSPKEVLFDAGGGLDRRRHQDPVLIRLDYDDGTREVIAVGVYGTVE